MGRYNSVAKETIAIFLHPLTIFNKKEEQIYIITSWTKVQTTKTCRFSCSMLKFTCHNCSTSNWWFRAFTADNIMPAVAKWPAVELYFKIVLIHNMLMLYRSCKCQSKDQIFKQNSLSCHGNHATNISIKRRCNDFNQKSHFAVEKRLLSKTLTIFDIVKKNIVKYCTCDPRTITWYNY